MKFWKKLTPQVGRSTTGTEQVVRLLWEGEQAYSRNSQITALGLTIGRVSFEAFDEIRRVAGEENAAQLSEREPYILYEIFYLLLYVIDLLASAPAMIDDRRKLIDEVTPYVCESLNNVLFQDQPDLQEGMRADFLSNLNRAKAAYAEEYNRHQNTDQISQREAVETIIQRAADNVSRAAGIGDAAVRSEILRICRMKCDPIDFKEVFMAAFLELLHEEADIKFRDELVAAGSIRHISMTKGPDPKMCHLGDLMHALVGYEASPKMYQRIRRIQPEPRPPSPNPKKP